LWVRLDCLGALKPAFRGWFSQGNPMSWDLDGFRFAPEARRFESGTPTPLPYVASLPGIRWVLGQGVETLLTHNRTLTGRLIDGLVSTGLKLAMPAEPSRRGGSVMVDLGSTEAAETAVRQLAAVGFFTDNRASILRISPGAITSPRAIDRCLDVLACCAIGAWPDTHSSNSGAT